MLSFRNLSLRRKQTLVMMLISTLVLLLACAAFSIFEVITFRRSLVESVSVLAEAIGNNSVAAIDFNDPRAAIETLSALQADPQIIGACIYTKSGEVFANYDRANDDITFTAPALSRQGHTFQRQRLVLSRPIIRQGEAIGVVYLESDMRALSSRLWRYAGIVGLVFLASLLLAFMLSNQLQRLVSDPILQLAQVARSVALEKNYSVRAVKESTDELGQLVDGFNEMLAQIQARDTALEAARNKLEHRVEERTEELASSLSVLNATLDSTADGILAVNLFGKAVSYNRKFALMWGIPSAMLGRRDGNEMTAFVALQVSNPEQFGQRIQELYANPGEEAFDVIELKDGRTIERNIQPQRAGGDSVGLVINFRDITERKRAEAELENIHKQLIEASRRGGMAEIATNVLHNVGNVLNSVNVSASLVADNVKKSKASSLAKVVGLLQQHQQDLGTFITSDPKGKQLPAYLAQLSDQLLADQAAAVQELASLRANIEHIKEIVAMQQSYAMVSGVKELVDLAELVEDSLRMNTGALSRHHVELVREFENVPPMNVEKHKILQILVNLVRNAKHACQDSDRLDKRLAVRLTNGDGRIRISVIDNGVGILPENLTRIFNHGFTTRKDGHGFGLHSGALAAKEMGGSLTVHSDGPGQGATVTLELPCQPSDPKLSAKARTSPA
jgi:PAS domain S-box-containing protein